MWFYLNLRFKEKDDAKYPKTQVLVHRLSPEISQCGISINFHDLINLIGIFKSYLNLRSENFPGEGKLPMELAVVRNKLLRPLRSIWCV